MMEERRETRRFPRLRSEHAVMWRRLDGGEEALSRTATVGLGGCSFATDEPLEPGTLLELLISVRGQVVKARARVVYAERSGEDVWQVGVEFVDVPPRDRAVLRGLVAGDACG